MAVVLERRRMRSHRSIGPARAPAPQGLPTRPRPLRLCYPGPGVPWSSAEVRAHVLASEVCMHGRCSEAYVDVQTHAATQLGCVIEWPCARLCMLWEDGTTPTRTPLPASMSVPRVACGVRPLMGQAHGGRGVRSRLCELDAV